MTVKLMVACHKKCDVPADPMYLPVFVGAAGKEDIGFQRDDSGDNMSAKNPLYCELTGLYWCWKNLDCDYLGLVHYRRYFVFRKKLFRQKNNDLDSVLTSREAEELTSRYDLILPKKRYYFIETIYSHYAHTFDGRQFDVAQEVLDEMFPEYGQAFRTFMKQRSGYIFNMFIMPKKLCDEYCEWLFQVTEEIEKRYDTTGMSDFEKRYIGRVSERLFNAWIMVQISQNRLRKDRIHELPYTYLGKVNWPKKILGFAEAKLLHKKYKKSF